MNYDVIIETMARAMYANSALKMLSCEKLAEIALSALQDKMPDYNELHNLNTTACLAAGYIELKNLKRA